MLAARAHYYHVRRPVQNSVLRSARALGFSCQNSEPAPILTRNLGQPHFLLRLAVSVRHVRLGRSISTRQPGSKPSHGHLRRRQPYQFDVLQCGDDVHQFSFWVITYSHGIGNLHARARLFNSCYLALWQFHPRPVLLRRCHAHACTQLSYAAEDQHVLPREKIS